MKIGSHQFIGEAEKIDPSPIRTESRFKSSSCRYRPRRARSGKWPHIHLWGPGRSRNVRDPLYVRREDAFILDRWCCEKWIWFAISCKWQNPQVLLGHDLI